MRRRSVVIAVGRSDGLMPAVDCAKPQGIDIAEKEFKGERERNIVSKTRIWRNQDGFQIV